MLYFILYIIIIITFIFTKWSPYMLEHKHMDTYVVVTHIVVVRNSIFI